MKVGCGKELGPGTHTRIRSPPTKKAMRSQGDVGSHRRDGAGHREQPLNVPFKSRPYYIYTCSPSTLPRPVLLQYANIASRQERLKAFRIIAGFYSSHLEVRQCGWSLRWRGVFRLFCAAALLRPCCLEGPGNVSGAPGKVRVQLALGARSGADPRLGTDPGPAARRSPSPSLEPTRSRVPTRAARKRGGPGLRASRVPAVAPALGAGGGGATWGGAKPGGPGNLRQSQSGGSPSPRMLLRERAVQAEHRRSLPSLRSWEKGRC